MIPDPPKKLEVVMEGLLGVVFDPCLFPFEARRWAEVLEEELTVQETNMEVRVWYNGVQNLVATLDTP